MKKFLLLTLGLTVLCACQSTSDFAVAVDDSNIYYNECENVLNVWYHCELKSRSTVGKPIMQRVQNTIAGDDFWQHEQ